MNTRIISFIDENLEDIDNENWTDLFQTAWEELDKVKVNELITVLLDIDIDYEILIWASIEGQFLNRIAFELDNSAFSDMAESWSRLNWMLNAMETFYHKTWSQVKQHILDNAEKLNLTIKPLDLRYSWDGSPEFDLGWFKPEYFEDQ